VLPATLLERWPQVCRFKTKFRLLPKNWFVSTRTNSMKCFVNWNPANSHVRSIKTQPCLHYTCDPFDCNVKSTCSLHSTCTCIILIACNLQSACFLYTTSTGILIACNLHNFYWHSYCLRFKLPASCNPLASCALQKSANYLHSTYTCNRVVLLPTNAMRFSYLHLLRAQCLRKVKSETS